MVIVIKVLRNFHLRNDGEDMNISSILDVNISELDVRFKDCGDVVKRKISIGEGFKKDIYFFYLDMLVDKDYLSEHIIKSLMISIREVPPTYADIKENIYEAIKNGGLPTADLKDTEDMDDAVKGILSGDTLMFVDGYAKAVVLSTKGWPNRGVPTADTEVVVQGAKEAFSEVFRINTMLIRRRIRDTALKLKQMQIGRRTRTDIAVIYMDGLVRPKILEESIKRLNNIDIDGIIDSGYVEQLIEEDWRSPFPQAQVTERPDKAAAALLEGRIVIVVDNSPFVLIIPATLNTFYQSPDDYNQRWEISSLIRALRFIAGFAALTLPGLYLAMAVYHPSMIPSQLVFKMAGARQTVPFPAVFEIILMEIAFELLREAGIRLPSPIGSTVGIVGGIIIGQAAVEAGLVSPIVVIVVAITGICGFVIPHISLVNAFRILKYLIIFLSSCLGFFGFWIAVLLILIHLVTLKSFGIPYVFPFSSSETNGYTDLKDSIFRMPLFMMKKRPIFSNPDNTTRLRVKQSGNKHKKE